MLPALAGLGVFLLAPILAIAKIATMVGLLGTVISMINTFNAISEAKGGDPRGDGSGDAGYSVTDEINRLRYVRGALGMPKNTKDTGGCQVFVMHCAYPPLDGNYTCFGRVVSGLEVVDRIRVGDRIRSARVLLPE